MSTALTIAGATLTAGGAVAVAAGLTNRGRARDHELAEILDLPFGEDDVELRERLAHSGVIAGSTLDLADRAISAWDPGSVLRDRVLRADLAVRPAEVVVLAAASAVATAAFVVLATGRWWTGLIPLVLAPIITHVILGALAARRARKFSAQLPDALSLAAASMHAGHTFLRALQMMTEDLEGPLGTEFRRVLNETELGAPLVDSLDRLAKRMSIRDLDWMVQAIRIQQTVGGQLADLLETLAEFMRSREEVRREISVLTAEGRTSAWVLGAMPIALFAAIAVMNPGYLDPMLRGWGPIWLGLTCVSVAVGMAFIFKMVRSVEV